MAGGLPAGCRPGDHLDSRTDEPAHDAGSPHVSTEPSRTRWLRWLLAIINRRAYRQRPRDWRGRCRVRGIIGFRWSAPAPTKPLRSAHHAFPSSLEARRANALIALTALRERTHGSNTSHLIPMGATVNWHGHASDFRLPKSNRRDLVITCPPQVGRCPRTLISNSNG